MSIIQQAFIPGSQWLYIKLYTGEKTADEILIKVICPILKRLQKKQYFKKWFFIRYSDPDFHLRIRVLVSNSQYVGELILLFYQKLHRWNKDHLVWKVQLDTYNREIERYGKNLIEEAESVFYADSECILSIIKKIDGDENYRWMIALVLINDLLSDFCLTIEEKQKLMKNLSRVYKTEFGFNIYNSKQFNVKFRVYKNIIESILDNTFNEKKFISLFRPIKKRTKEFMIIAEQIKIKSRKDNGIDELLKSYLHMMLNRLFLSKNRMHEMVLYEFMFRYYTSEIAKKIQQK